MPIEVSMPAISPTMEFGDLIEWKVKVGDLVREGDVLAEVQTDKAAMPMTSFDEGTVAHLAAAAGQTVKVGDVMLVLATKGEDPKAIAAKFGGSASASAAPTAAPATPSVAAAPSGSNGHAASAPTAVASIGGRVRSTPLARKVATAAGIDIATVPPSGPGGRIIRSDVEAFATAKPAAPAPNLAPKPTVAPSRTTVRIPHTTMRKTIASRMLLAKQVAPEIHVTVDIRIDKLMEVREALNKSLAAEKLKLSVGDFITKAAGLALRKHPALNASYETDAIVQHGDVNVGIAVALEGGLMVPVVRGADNLGLRDIRLATDEIVKSVRSGRPKSEHITGGTFTISNLGMYGVRQFDAILNLPEVAILAVGAGEKRPVVEGDKLVIGIVMSVTLTADHRAVDGAAAAEFLQTFKGLLEEPAMMLL